MSNLRKKCNQYCFEEIILGMEESFQVKITKDKQDAFTILSGDINPMHIDSEFAMQRGYKDCLVYGMCTASVYSALVGVYLPGEKCLFHECSIQWPKPVYIGDELTVYGKVAEIDERSRRITIKAYIRNQDGIKVSRAKLIVGILESSSDMSRGA